MNITGFYQRHRKLSILGLILLAVVLLAFIVPYLIPLGSLAPGIPAAELVTENGSFLDIGGISIYVESYNPESTLGTIVFIHGFGGSTFSWRENAPFFVQKGYRVVALDLKGFGLSQKDFGPDYSHPAQAELVNGALERLGIDRAWFIGHSMGASVMLHLAHLYPQKITGLVSVDGAVVLQKSFLSPAPLAGFGPFTRAGSVLLTRYINQDRVRSILESACYRKETVTDEVFEGYYNRIITGNWYQSLLAMTRDSNKNAVTFPLEELNYPALIMWGEHDTWVTREDIDLWKDRLPGAEFYIITDAGHLPMEEQPDVFNGLVLEFIQGN
ncbi:MAG: alpha/beta hydrolase [Dehalococcoidaceae bacterium]|nr:alpha/beta hydrolase [Dehalococcoidaceae bacterium]